MFGRGESPKWVLKEVPRISPAAALGLLSQPSQTRIGDKKLKHGQRFCIEHDERTSTWAIGFRGRGGRDEYRVGRHL